MSNRKLNISVCFILPKALALSAVITAASVLPCRDDCAAKSSQIVEKTSPLAENNARHGTLNDILPVIRRTPGETGEDYRNRIKLAIQDSLALVIPVFPSDIQIALREENACEGKAGLTAKIHTGSGKYSAEAAICEGRPVFLENVRLDLSGRKKPSTAEEFANLVNSASFIRIEPERLRPAGDFHSGKFFILKGWKNPEMTRELERAGTGFFARAGKKNCSTPWNTSRSYFVYFLDKNKRGDSVAELEKGVILNLRWLNDAELRHFTKLPQEKPKGL